MTSREVAGHETGDLFAVIDRRDSEAFVGYLTDDAVFRFGSAPAVKGRETIRKAVEGFFGTIAGCSHAVHKTLDKGATKVCEGEVTYTRLDGSTITLPFTDVFEYDGDLIAHYKIYMDISPLYVT